jgi:phospholipase C
MNPIKHVVIIVKENHTFDNYFGTFPGADGIGNLPHAPNPPTNDPPHDHSSWLKRNTIAVRQQYKESDIPAYFSYARQFTLCDRFFTDVAGPSAPNHLMLVTADSPIVDNISFSNTKQPFPPFNLPSLPKQLEKKGLDWRNYGGLVFLTISNLILSTKNRLASQFAKDAKAGKLPEVSWVFPRSGESEHPTANVTDGMKWTMEQVNAVVKGGLWNSTVIFIVWDDYGGWYDHVVPPNIEQWKDGSQFRFGSRVGCLVLSPYAKKGYISKSQHSFVSLISFCEKTFNLPSLNTRTKNSDAMEDCFDFTQTPLAPPKFP